ncbi:MAG: DNA internalization-related competence protein ComEC/Rec2 [Lachnospiraceae bacterium]|nr:DNA internalization-related competence protein ComEC/Rec2 [Lachnospiraceae bacterium]
MEKRPLCLVFFGLIILIVILDLSGIVIGVPPDLKEAEKTLKNYDGGCMVSGVLSDRSKTEKGYSYHLKDAVITHRKRTFHIGCVRINSTSHKFKVGSEIRAYGRLAFYERASNPGGFDAKKYYMGENVYSSLNLRSFTVLKEPAYYLPAEIGAKVREDLSETFISVMGEKAGGILSAMIIGDRSGIDEETRINYSVSGLSHLLAISGLHIGIFGAALLSLLLIIGMPRLPASLLSSFLLILYSVFSGGRESTVRAAVMFTAGAAAVLLRKSYDTLSALSLSGIVLILINPYRIYRVGFQLSFAAVAGLAVLYPQFKKAFRTNADRKKAGMNPIRRVKTMIQEGAMVWQSENAATIPIVLWNYSEIPVFQAAANILLVPLTEIILLLGIAGGAVSVVYPAAGRLGLFVPAFLIRIQEGAGAFLRWIPGAVWITGFPGIFRVLLYYSGLFILIAVWIRTRSGDKNQAKLKPAVVIPDFLMIFMIFIRVPNSFEVTALDVGQGDCAALTAENGSAFLIDGGSSSIRNAGSNVILPYLKNKGIGSLEGIFISHDDADHVNGIEQLLAMSSQNLTAIQVKRVFMPFWMLEDESCAELIGIAESAGAEVIGLKAGDRISSSGMEIEVLSPDPEAGFTGNEGSLVLGVRYRSFSGLFTGDLGGEAEDQILENLDHYSILKAGHHGSANSTSSEFLAAVKPDFCIISAPRISSYGHPSPEMLDRLEQAQVPWLQTGISGALSFTVRRDRIIIRPYKV